ncbi:hypothetical protein TanjilG_02569 [Lupinus angustifolius]|uniref:Condensation domain-containing protein n=1 Tax=Lupinus angustifolius TaxID=3871 RepID=A0A394DDS1_LUPAN|nr:PREDICTED: uncharacterized protein LOC109339830 [Lupinus angustifolius]OIW21402.1 hypothetical protein TanjilG_02569 [Lupinus angustifolius]
MSSTKMVDPKVRNVGATEYSWCKAVHGGTGIAVLALLSSKKPDISHFQIALNKLQNSHPILKSKLHSNTTTSNGNFTFLTFQNPFVKIQQHNLSLTSNILGRNKNNDDTVSSFQLILEHELNQNSWHNDLNRSSSHSDDMFVASIYAMPEETWTVVMRLHVAACDRTTAISILREMLVLMKEEERESESEEWKKREIGFAMEDLVDGGKGKKGIWARGIDVLSYSLNSFRLTNLKFCDTKGTRFSQVVRLQLNHNDTKRVLDGCKHNRIKLCGALSAAGLMAAHSSKNSSRKYGIITLTDCRSSLEPPLSINNFGFYHSAILNSHLIKGGEDLWELAKKTYGAFANSKNNNKHFSDMADMNFLMCKAIDNPTLTSSSSLRTSIMSVFEDTVIDDGGKVQREVGVDDYMGCASIHGVGPSIAIFDTIREAKLDCIFVYPAPLHSREQMLDLVNKMKVILIEGGKAYEG